MRCPRLLVGIVALLLVAGLGCDSDEGDGVTPGRSLPTSADPNDLSGTTGIGGRVVEFESGVGISEARISLYPGSGSSVLSRPDGAFALTEGVQPGLLYTVVAEADGYASGQAPVVTKRDTLRVVDLPLIPSERALGVAFDPPVAAIASNSNLTRVTMTSMEPEAFSWRVVDAPQWLQVLPNSGELASNNASRLELSLVPAAYRAIAETISAGEELWTTVELRDERDRVAVLNVLVIPADPADVTLTALLDSEGEVLRIGRRATIFARAGYRDADLDGAEVALDIQGPAEGLTLLEPPPRTASDGLSVIKLEAAAPGSYALSVHLPAYPEVEAIPLALGGELVGVRIEGVESGRGSLAYWDGTTPPAPPAQSGDAVGIGLYSSNSITIRNVSVRGIRGLKPLIPQQAETNGGPAGESVAVLVDGGGNHTIRDVSIESVLGGEGGNYEGVSATAGSGGAAHGIRLTSAGTVAISRVEVATVLGGSSGYHCQIGGACTEEVRGVRGAAHGIFVESSGGVDIRNVALRDIDQGVFGDSTLLEASCFSVDNTSGLEIDHFTCRGVGNASLIWDGTAWIVQPSGDGIRVSGSSSGLIFRHGIVTEVPLEEVVNTSSAGAVQIGFTNFWQAGSPFSNVTITGPITRLAPIFAREPLGTLRVLPGSNGCAERGSGQLCSESPRASRQRLGPRLSRPARGRLWDGSLRRPSEA